MDEHIRRIMASRSDLPKSFSKLKIMATVDNDRYQVLRSQILANAYFVYPKKASRPIPPAPGTVTSKRQKFDESSPSDENSLAQYEMDVSQDMFSQSSQPLSSLEDVETWPTHKQDLEVAICSYIEDESINDESPEQFYAIVYDKNSCSGYDPLEQQRLSMQQRHKLKGVLHTLKPKEDCKTEEDALRALCKELQRKADGLVLNKHGMLKLDRRIHDEALGRRTHGERGDKKKLHRDTAEHVEAEKSRIPRKSQGPSTGPDLSHQEPREHSMEEVIHTSTQDAQRSGATDSPDSPDSQATVAWSPAQEAQLIAKYVHDKDTESSDAFDTMSDTRGRRSPPPETIPTQPLPK